ncbi:MAG: purine-nucleoside phosphorylase [candidate division WOR-3 bacterium]|nr:purine-nucleoside phosphorylase [candidate division WOR-3 bacterium]MDW8113517.1 purine-nucleoside phosphorylase [candidate division WOR-3 bacterium]
MKEKIKEAVDFIKKESDFKPKIGIILGTGLGKLAEEIEIVKALPYSEIPNFPMPTVITHEGRLIFGYINKKRVCAFQGRFHYYEGYSMFEITLPVRVMKELGVEVLIVSNASGGLNPLFSPGDIMIITDHINFLCDNPLRGLIDPDFGPRFPDMYNCYDKNLIKIAEEVALDLKIPIKKGIYIAVMGPNLETAAEYRAFRILGADAVGMSTVPEVIVARQVGIKVIGFSVITDMGLPDALKPVNLAEILRIAKETEPKLTALIKEFIKRLNV